MLVEVFNDYEEMSRRAARHVAAAIRQKPDLVLGLATGSTPVGLYRELVRLFRKGELDFSRVTTFNLDEYYGLSASHEQSYHYFMQEHLFRHVNVALERIHIPDGQATDIQAECARYEQLLAEAGWVDLQILGIGGNGHIGFNEPGTDFGASTHLIELAPATIQANARFFKSPEDVPRRAISMGIKTIMRSREIILLASGRDKAEAIRAAIEGPVTNQVPASVLQLHPNVRVMIDQAAAALLSHGGQGQTHAMTV